jgi:hypothetical protein
MHEISLEVIFLAKKSAKKKPKSVKKKKTAKKKVPTRVKIEVTIIKSAPKDKEFVLTDGRKLKDLRELAFCLSDMADDVFWSHVNDAKNDFAAWIDDSLKDKELANKLKPVRDRLNTQVAILKHIVRKI